MTRPWPLLLACLVGCSDPPAQPTPMPGPCRDYARAVSMGSDVEVNCPRADQTIAVERSTWGADLVVCRCPRAGGAK